MHCLDGGELQYFLGFDCGWERLFEKMHGIHIRKTVYKKQTCSSVRSVPMSRFEANLGSSHVTVTHLSAD